MIENTFIINPIRTDFISKCIETLYKYTDMTNNKVIVVDQTRDGLKLPMGRVHLVLRPHRNLGFSKSLNEGIVHALHWQSKYITCLNDDIEFIHKSWWQGILDTFNMDSGNEILVVNPESIRTPLWGYGRPPNEYVEVLDHKENYTNEDYNLLLNGDFSHLKEKYPNLPKSFPLNYVGVCDAFAAFAPVFKRKHFDLIGLWDERYYPSGGEDYWMMCRIYRKKYRAVSTRHSWVWHWWSKSKDNKEGQNMGLPIDDERRWADITYLCPPEWNEGHPMDVWGFYTSKDGTKKPFKMREEIGIVDI